jgi:hypothetical protein
MPSFDLLGELKKCTHDSTLPSLEPIVRACYTDDSGEVLKKEEQCGFVLVDGTIAMSPNTHPEPADNFRFDPFFVANYNRADIAALWHTHWSNGHPGEFTQSDLNLAHGRDRLPIVLYHSTFKCWDYYEPQNPNPFPLTHPPFDVTSVDSYLNWSFSWGRMDCFALVRRYCLGVLNHDIGEMKRPELQGFPPKGWEGSWDREAYGLVEVFDRPRKYDLLEIAIGGGRITNHAAVIVDDGLETGQAWMLHNPGYLDRSRLEQYSEGWIRRTVRRLRIERLG